MKENFTYGKQYEFQADNGSKVEVKVEVKVNDWDIKQSDHLAVKKIIQQLAECMHNSCSEISLGMKGSDLEQVVPIPVLRPVLIERKKILIEGILAEEGVTYEMAREIISKIDEQSLRDADLFLNNNSLRDIRDWNERRIREMEAVTIKEGE